MFAGTPRLAARSAMFALVACLPLVVQAAGEATASSPAAPSTVPVARAVAAAPSTAAPAPAPDNAKLDSAKALIGKRRYDDALKALDAADEFPDNTPEMKREITFARVASLEKKRRPDHAGARAIVLDLLHADPDGATLKDAPDEIQSIAKDIRASQPLIVHVPVVVGKPDRPVTLRANVRDNVPGRVLTLTLNYKPHDANVYSQEPFRKDSGGFSAVIRSPDALAPPGVDDDYLVDYYISAAFDGNVLDTNTPDDRPTVIHVSAKAAKEAEIKAGINIELVEHPPPPPLPPPLPPPPPPWFTRWYAIAGGSAVVVGVTAGIIVAATHKPALPSSIGVLNLP